MKGTLEQQDPAISHKLSSGGILSYRGGLMIYIDVYAGNHAASDYDNTLG